MCVMIKKVYPRVVSPIDSVGYLEFLVNFQLNCKFVKRMRSQKNRCLEALLLGVFVVVVICFLVFFLIMNSNGFHVTIYLYNLFQNISEESVLNYLWLWKVCSCFFRLQLDLIPADICHYSPCPLMPPLSFCFIAMTGC